ncbi:MAG: hypothetical protein ACK55O_01185 [Phycisphaerales bacterium]|nr:hypothetical protein [Phycisphaeraceae bacterium]
MIRHALDTLGGIWQLARLAIISRGRLGGAYWTWRTHTAFGKGRPPTRREAFAAALGYGRWVHRMRRGR